MTSKTPLITSHDDWTPELLREVWVHIEDIAKNDLKLDYYEPQFEIISAEQMIDAYSSMGSPVNYSHWSFGKDFMSNWNGYQKGRMSIAYEIVIGTNPTIAYLMEENNAVTQALVMAHAGCGHSFVFKNNYMFKEWNQAESIIDYMVFAKGYIKDCEEKYGVDEVERVLDSAHAIASHGVDKRKRKHQRKLTREEEQSKLVNDTDDRQKELDIIIKTTSTAPQNPEEDTFSTDEENLLYFIYKNAPDMPEWKRELLRIVHKINQHHYPSRFTKVVHEGMATFTHFYIMDELEKRGIISADAQLAWLQLHSGVIYQPDMHSRHYDGSFNPYALGLDILREVRRICEDPTEEDREWFPNLVGSDWREEIKRAVTDFRDESFIEQYLSPNLMRRYRMMSLDIQGGIGIVSEVSDENGYRALRSALAAKYNPINYIPEIYVHRAHLKGDRKLTLGYQPYLDRKLHEGYAKKTLEHIRLLWGHDVEIVDFSRGNEVIFST